MILIPVANDGGTLRRYPVITFGIIGLCSIVALLQVIYGAEAIISRFGFVPARFSLVTLFTSMFVHLGFVHLFFNMLFLYMTGPLIEDAWSRPAFLAFYLLSGAVASTVFALSQPGNEAFLVGASGAVAAVMGAFLVRYPRARIRLLTVLWRPFVFGAPAWLLISLWFAGELAAARGAPTAPLDDGDRVQVANWVHVWGLLCGAAIAAAIRALQLESRHFAPAVEEHRLRAQRGPVPDLDRLVQQGRHTEACRQLAAALLRTPDDVALAATYWDLSRLGAMTREPGVGLRIIQRDLEQQRHELAIQRWDELHSAAPQVAPDTRLAVLLSRRLRRDGRAADAQDVIEACYDRMNHASGAQSWAELAEYCATVDDPLAGTIVRRAMSHPSLPAETRGILREWLRLRGGLTPT